MSTACFHMEFKVFKTEVLQKSDNKINGAYDPINKCLENT
jgi:hypothetical protein